MRRFVFVLMLLTVVAMLPGCAAVQSRELMVQAKMSDTIFLDPETLEDGKAIYVRVTNTSDFQEIDFGEMIKARIRSFGRKVTNKPKEAAYIVQANLLYMGQEKKDYTYEGALAGGFGGAITGAALSHHSSGWSQAGIAAGAGLAGAGVGALIGSTVSVDTYLGVCDVQIKEVVEGGVVGVESADLKQGSGNRIRTERNIQQSRQEYQTRIGVRAKQTNINREEATRVITERLAAQIAGYFK